MFSSWGRYLSIALPGLAALCLEWWTFEVIVMLAGVLPRTDAEVSVSVMGVSFDITTIAYMLPAGIGGGLFPWVVFLKCTLCMPRDKAATSGRLQGWGMLPAGQLHRPCMHGSLPGLRGRVAGTRPERRGAS